MFNKKIITIFLVTLFTCFNVNSKDTIKQNKPIKIESNEISMKKNSNIIVFTGNVEATQDNLVILTDKMLVEYEGENIDIKNIKLFGNVILKNDTIVANSGKGEYNLLKNIITLENNVVLTEKDVVVYGDKMTYDTIKQESKVYGSKKENNRITIILDNINNLKERYDK